MQTLKGRTCVLAGGTAGDGTAIPKSLAMMGMNVVLMTHNPEKAQALIDEAKEAGAPGEIIAFTGIPGQAAELVPETYDYLQKKFGSVDVIICNTGNNGVIKPIEQVTEEMLMQPLKHLVVGSFLMLSTALPYLKQSKAPRVIFMTTVEGEVGGTEESFTNAVAKGAVRSLTMNCAARLAKYGITVNCISKGAIPRIGPQPEGSPDPMKRLPRIPLGRLGTSMDLAQLICFIASEESAYITGESFELSGGLNLT